MKTFFSITKGIGFIALMLGMGAMDSDSIIVPILIMLFGIGLFAFSAYIEDWFIWDEGRRGKR